MRAAQVAALVACLSLLAAALVAPKTHVRAKRVLMLGAAVLGAVSTVIGATA